VLSAHPGKSQGRPRTTPSAQLISQNGLPDRVSQQQPQHPEARCSRRGRTAFSCPDNGSEFRSSEFGQAVAALGARQRFIKAGRPNSNGCVERLQLTILEECWRPSFARSLVPKMTALQRDLDEYLHDYNFDRAHTGRLTRGRVPADIVLGARKTRPVR
jgi:Integrase core domain